MDFLNSFIMSFNIRTLFIPWTFAKHKFKNLLNKCFDIAAKDVKKTCLCWNLQLLFRLKLIKSHFLLLSRFLCSQQLFTSNFSLKFNNWIKAQLYWTTNELLLINAANKREKIKHLKTVSNSHVGSGSC